MFRTLLLLCLSLDLAAQDLLEPDDDFSPEAILVLDEDFSKDPGPAWAFTGQLEGVKQGEKPAPDIRKGAKLIFQPQEGQRLLGRFGKGELSLALEKLPAHQALRIQFDLFFIGTWDGLGDHGPDRLFFGPADGAPLVDAVWNNCYVLDTGNRLQSFPDNFHPLQQQTIQRARGRTKINAIRLLSQRGGTGVEEIGLLGIGQLGVPTDIRYRFDLTFRHSTPVLNFLFTSMAGAANDEAFAIDNVTLHALPEIPPITATEECALWLELLSDEPMIAREAQSRLALYPDLVAKKLELLLPRADELDVDHLLTQIAEGSPAEQSAAAKTLYAKGRAVRQDLVERLERTSPSAQLDEFRRLTELLQALDSHESAVIDRLDSRRLWRLADLARQCPGAACARYIRILDSLASDALSQVLAPETHEE